MSRLRFNTDEGRRVVALLRQNANHIVEEVTALAGNANNLVGHAWQAEGARRFQEAMTAWQRAMQDIAERLDALAVRLQEEIVQWEETAAVFGGQSATAVAEQAFFEPLRKSAPAQMPEILSPLELVATAPPASSPAKEEPVPPPAKEPPLPQAVADTARWLAGMNITNTRVLSYSPVRGETVPGDDGQNNYYRFSHKRQYRSNCTWYAAAAVAAASEGRINLQNYGGKTGIKNLGDGGNWAENADKWVQEYERKQTPPEQRIVTGVDKTPRAGDVYADNKSHVAFVEEVRLSEDGKEIYVVVSEENYGDEHGRFAGEPLVRKYSKPVQVQEDPFPGEKDIRRYRRVIALENANAGTDKPPATKGEAEFIHFNYDYGK